MYDCIKSNCQYCERCNVQTIENSCRQCWNKYQRKNKNYCNYCWCEDHTNLIKVDKWLFRLCSGCRKSHSSKFLTWIHFSKKTVSFAKNQIKEYILSNDERIDKIIQSRRHMLYKKKNICQSILVKKFYRNHFIKLSHAEQEKIRIEIKNLQTKSLIFKRYFIEKIYLKFGRSASSTQLEEGYETIFALVEPIEM